jgi:hypothetical protein
MQYIALSKESLEIFLNQQLIAKLIADEIEKDKDKLQ